MQPPTHKTQRVFSWLLAGLALTLSVLPLLVSVNEGLTKVVERILLYQYIQAWVVPYEIRVVGTILTLLGFSTHIQADGLTIHGVFLRLTWNCVGWQSILLLALSLLVGLGGKYTKGSIVQTIVLGLAGTFLVNVLRMVTVVILAAVAPSIFAIVFHDYLAALLTVLWLMFFWWLAYSFVLTEA